MTPGAPASPGVNVGAWIVCEDSSDVTGSAPTGAESSVQPKTSGTSPSGSETVTGVRTADLRYDTTSSAGRTTTGGWFGWHRPGARYVTSPAQFPARHCVSAVQTSPLSRRSP